MLGWRRRSQPTELTESQQLRKSLREIAASCSAKLENIVLKLERNIGSVMNLKTSHRARLIDCGRIDPGAVDDSITNSFRSVGGMRVGYVEYLNARRAQDLWSTGMEVT